MQNPQATTGTLYLIPTALAPNTAKALLAPQVAQLMPTLSHFLVENVRTARRYISSLQLGINIEPLHFEELTKKTSPQAIAQLMQPLLQGHGVGVMSEAGSPGVADPGALAVAWAHEHQVPVVPLVGPSAFLLALMGSGFSGQRFTFHGYLPIDKKKRQESIKHLEQQVQRQGSTQMFMETPYRNNPMLQDLLQVCQPSTRLCIAANLTAPNQLLRTATIKAWKSQKPDLHKIPTVFLLGT